MCVFYSKKLFTAVHNFVHLNLAIALFIGYLVFAVGVELAKDNKVEYITIGIKTCPWLLCWLKHLVLFYEKLGHRN